MFTIGADPEFFVRRITKQGKLGNYVPASLLCPGTKEDVIDLGNGYSIHADNVTLEVNLPPCPLVIQGYAALNKWITTCVTAKYKAKRYLEEMYGEHRYILCFNPIHKFTEKALEKAGENAQLFRCHPDTQIWEWAKPPSDPTGGWRTTGGHIHLGWENPSPGQQLAVAQSMDLFVGYSLSRITAGVPILTRENGEKVRAKMHKDEVRRRSFYGAAGAVRYKEYGLEYRTPSSLWMSSTRTMEMMYNMCAEAIRHAPAVARVLNKRGRNARWDKQRIYNDLHRVIDLGRDECWEVCVKRTIMAAEREMRNVNG